MLCCSISDIDLCFVFFKQKTAYEMRISDWSSDVCSSDLASMPGRLPRSFTGSASMQITHCMPYRNDQSIVSIVSPRTASACVHGMPHASMLRALLGLSPMYIAFADCLTPHSRGRHSPPSFDTSACVFQPPLESGFSY